MATQEEITAAYELIFKSEQDKARLYIKLVDQFNKDLTTLANSLPEVGDSALRNAISQSRSALNMYTGTTGHLEAVYRLNEEQTPSADSTV